VARAVRWRDSIGGAGRSVCGPFGSSAPCDHRRVLGIDHVQVTAPAGSEPEARRFYGDLLGLPEVRKPDALQSRGGVWFACGAQQLHVGIAEPFSPATKAHPAFRVQLDDLDRLAGRLEDAGCTVGWDDAIPGTRRFFTADPWGNRLELVGAGA
jgi:catechol 2,3-dioxygenase-like lactoylglutathione lyase family enzyme